MEPATGAIWNRQFMEDVFSGNKAYSSPCIPYVNYEECVAPFSDQRVWTHATCVAVGNLYKFNNKYRYNELDHHVIALGDMAMINPNRPNQAVARDNYLSAIRNLISYVQQCPDMVVAEDIVLRPDGPDNNVLIVDERNIFLPVTFEEAFEYIQLNEDFFAKKFKVWEVITYATHAIVSLCKKGVVSPGYIRKISTAMRTELGAAVTLNSAVITRFYTLYDKGLTEANARVFFDQLRGWIPAAALRIGIVIQQALDHGITAINLISRAYNEFPGFNWALCDFIAPGEMGRVGRAIAVWDGNPYAGFRSNLGDLAATKYKIATYVAKKLLIDGRAEESLVDYRGGHQDPIDLLDNEIARFIQNNEPRIINGVINRDQLTEGQRLLYDAAVENVNQITERLNAINLRPQV